MIADHIDLKLSQDEVDVVLSALRGARYEWERASALRHITQEEYDPFVQACSSVAKKIADAINLILSDEKDCPCQSSH